MADFPIYRLVKGSTLTFTEMDDNLRWLSANMSASVVTITGSTYVLGNLNVSDGITGSLFGTSSWALNVATASYAINAVSSSYPIAVTGSTLYSFNAGVPSGTSTQRSIFLGSGSAYEVNDSSDSVFLGTEAGYKTTSTNAANFIGYRAGYSSSNSDDSVFIGTDAGRSSISAQSSVHIGPYAGQASEDAYNTVYIGAVAGNSAKFAAYSNFIGLAAGQQADYSDESNFIGDSTGRGATDARYSNFMGFSAGGLASYAAYSNFIGYRAGRLAISSSYSTLIGYQVGFQANATLGPGGYSLGIGSNNIIIGTNITLPNGTKDSINLGAIIFATGSYSTTVGNPFLGTSNGRVGINQPTPIFNLDVSGSGRYTNGLTISGSITGSNALLTGTLIVQTIVAQTITSSTEWITGSSIFGSLPTDTHQFTGSVLAPSITGSLFGTSSWAVSASWAPSQTIDTSRIVTGSVTASVNVDQTSFSIVSSSVSLLTSYKNGALNHGEGSVASGLWSHAESYYTRATGNYSYAQGENTFAPGFAAHAEGFYTTASGDSSHAEGEQTVTYGYHSHAEGRQTMTLGQASHAEGYNTVALGNYQHVQGQFNRSSSIQSAFIVGNGTSDSNRSNLIFAAGSTLQITGSLQVSDSITGSLQGTSSWAVSASWAPSSPAVATISSYIATGSVTASVNTDISASFRITSGSNTLLNVTKDGFVWIGNGSFVNQGYQLDVQGAIRATTTETYFDVASFGSTVNSRRLYVYVDPGGVGIANGANFSSQSVFLENNSGGVQISTSGSLRLYVSSSGQIKLNRYLAPFSFPGTPVGSLSYDSLGNIITTPFSTSYISTGSITASVNADPTASFKVTSGSRTLLTLTNDSKLVIGTPGEFIDYQLEVSGAIRTDFIYCNSNGSIASSFYGTGQLLVDATEQPVVYLESTWNTTGNARGIEYRVTNTASGGSSKLLNLFVDSVSMFNVSNSGSITTNAPTGYTNAAWKLGDATAGTITPDTYIKVEINGQIYSIPALLGTP
jgi:hypothetical protein